MWMFILGFLTGVIAVIAWAFAVNRSNDQEGE